MIAPIETKYSGVRFRSRLEARWALFFDTLGIDWDYEPDGYQLADGTRYLPDFAVMRATRFVEIKPEGDPFLKARAFAAECGKPVWLCEGAPGTKPWVSINRVALGNEDGTIAAEMIEEEVIFNPFKKSVWFVPSPEECEDFLGVAAAVSRAFRFWEPRQ